MIKIKFFVVAHLSRDELSVKNKNAQDWSPELRKNKNLFWQ